VFWNTQGGIVQGGIVRGELSGGELSRGELSGYHTLYRAYIHIRGAKKVIILIFGRIRMVGDDRAEHK